MSLNLYAQTGQLQKGIAAFENKKYAQAERIFDKLIKEEENNAEAYLWKGKCLQQFEEFQAAYEAFSIAKNLEPLQATYWLALGDFKYELGLFSIQKPHVCGDCGKVFLPDNSEMPSAIDFYKSALLDYEKAIQLDSQSAVAYYQLAWIYHHLGNASKACEMLSVSRKLNFSKAHQNTLISCP